MTQESHRKEAINYNNLPTINHGCGLSENMFLSLLVLSDSTENKQKKKSHQNGKIQHISSKKEIRLTKSLN